MEWLEIITKAIVAWFTRSDIYKQLAECKAERDKATLLIAELKYEVESYRDLSLIGTLTIDRYGKIIDASPEIAKMTGYSDGELMRMSLRDLLPYQFRMEHDVYIQEVVDGVRPVRLTLIEGEFRSIIGAPVPVLVKLAAIPAASGTKYRADVRRR